MPLSSHHLRKQKLSNPTTTTTEKKKEDDNEKAQLSCATLSYISTMPRKNSSGSISKRAWNVLRLALLWARKGGVFKRRLMMELRVVPKFLKNLGHSSSSTPRGQLYYRERELSFDNTPVFHVKMHRPASLRFSIPCITPHVVDFDDYDQGCYASSYYDHGGRMSFLKRADDCYDEEEYNYSEQEKTPVAAAEELGDEGIDRRAEEFIANFYEQMKLQRQISYLQYHETPKHH